MSCFFCKGEIEDITTTHFIDLKNCIIIIKNIPCMECGQCGEKFYTDAVAEQLDAIVESVRGLVTEIAVVNYPGCVA